MDFSVFDTQKMDKYEAQVKEIASDFMSMFVIFGEIKELINQKSLSAFSVLLT